MSFISSLVASKTEILEIDTALNGLGIPNKIISNPKFAQIIDELLANSKVKIKTNSDLNKFFKKYINVKTNNNNGKYLVIGNWNIFIKDFSDIMAIQNSNYLHSEVELYREYNPDGILDSITCTEIKPNIEEIIVKRRGHEEKEGNILMFDVRSDVCDWIILENRIIDTKFVIPNNDDINAIRRHIKECSGARGESRFFTQAAKRRANAMIDLVKKQIPNFEFEQNER